jgi:methylphosphotriester-DNA--protein-cysteine methyltransferase
MIPHTDLSTRQLQRLVHRGALSFAGHKGRKIYGRLDCRSGKRMHARNRVFFRDKQEALSLGYRPCGRCMKEAYQAWKKQSPFATFE